MSDEFTVNFECVLTPHWLTAASCSAFALILCPNLERVERLQPVAAMIVFQLSPFLIIVMMASLRLASSLRPLKLPAALAFLMPCYCLLRRSV